jgi:hypothetical protein
MLEGSYEEQRRILQVYHGWSTSIYVFPIAIFSVLYNTPKFFELEVGKGYQHNKPKQCITTEIVFKDLNCVLIRS